MQTRDILKSIILQHIEKGETAELLYDFNKDLNNKKIKEHRDSKKEL